MNYTTQNAKDDSGKPVVVFTFPAKGFSTTLRCADFPSGKAMIEKAMQEAREA